MIAVQRCVLVESYYRHAAFRKTGLLPAVTLLSAAWCYLSAACCHLDVLNQHSSLVQAGFHSIHSTWSKLGFMNAVRTKCEQFKQAF
jgi:hypothetical protein